ncbi:MAG: type II toxin-antitoxin system prevent-host-death family antitoxin [Rhizobiaceae bacterium]|nr:MAG: type II toxin-antitoxin system prevent-host-death family antitoxin [Rhizobiaceae bacterium]
MDHFRSANRLLVLGTPIVQISVTEAKGQRTELVRRAEAGDEIPPTRHGQAAVRLVPMRTVTTPQVRRALLQAVRKAGVAKAAAGPKAEKSQDFLYDENGLPK